MAEEHATAMNSAKAKSAQAFSQAAVCALLVPILGSALYALLPGIELHRKSWVFACSISILMSAIAAIWLLKLTDVARWGGLATPHRSWILSAQCAGEKFLALVRAGSPPDLAWSRAVYQLGPDAVNLADAWGHSVWDSQKSNSMKIKGGAEESLVGAGVSIRKTVQISLMEGRPCSDRVENILLSLRQEMKAHIDRELGLLSTRALKPLFICVAPALMGLLGYGIWLAAMDSSSGGFNAP